MFPGSTINGQWGPRRPQKVSIKWDKAHLGYFIAQSFALQYQVLGVRSTPYYEITRHVTIYTRLLEARRCPPFLLLSELIQVVMGRWAWHCSHSWRFGVLSDCQALRLHYARLLCTPVHHWGWRLLDIYMTSFSGGGKFLLGNNHYVLPLFARRLTGDWKVVLPAPRLVHEVVGAIRGFNEMIYYYWIYNMVYALPTQTYCWSSSVASHWHKVSKKNNKIHSPGAYVVCVR